MLPIMLGGGWESSVPRIQSVHTTPCTFALAGAGWRRRARLQPRREERRLMIDERCEDKAADQLHSTHSTLELQTNVHTKVHNHGEGPYY